jgi:hypothetical protein
MIEYQHYNASGMKGLKGPMINPYDMSQTQNNYDTNYLEDEEQAKYQSRKIGPFSFDIDDEIDTEVLTSEEVYKDLKELEVILDKESDKINITSKMLGRSKKKHK